MVATLEALEATIEVSERRKGEIGDPTVLRMMEAVERGAVPFSVQGTITPDHARRGKDHRLGSCRAIEPGAGGRKGGAVRPGRGWCAGRLDLAGACRDGIHQQWLDADPVLHTVQTEAAAPLNRAWRCLAVARWTASRCSTTIDAIDLAMGAAQRKTRIASCGPGRKSVQTAASGIVDDVTYDWLPVVEAMLRSEGQAKVVSEEMVTRANHLARTHTGIEVGHTGSAGLAGLLDPSLIEFVDRGQNVVVFFTGIDRHDR